MYRRNLSSIYFITIIEEHSSSWEANSRPASQEMPLFFYVTRRSGTVFKRALRWILSSRR